MINSATTATPAMMYFFIARAFSIMFGDVGAAGEVGVEDGMIGVGTIGAALGIPCWGATGLVEEETPLPVFSGLSGVFSMCFFVI